MNAGGCLKRLILPLCCALAASACGNDALPDGGLVTRQTLQTAEDIHSTTQTVPEIPEETASMTDTQQTTTAETTAETTETTTTTTSATTTTTTTTTTTATTTTTTTTPAPTTTTTAKPKPVTTTTAAATAAVVSTVKPAETSDCVFFVDTGEKQTVIRWDKVSGADGYEVALKRAADAAWETLADTKELSFTATGIGLDRNYIFTVKPYKLSGDTKEYSFKTRACAFPYMTQKNGVTYVDGLLIVNKTYSIPANFANSLTAETQAAFNKMQSAASAAGLWIGICSGFRSNSYQNSLYWSYVNRDGQAAADRYSARAGHSEHETGLAIDINNASAAFTYTPQAKWLAENCWKYGFIIRYPQGKENKTGYQYESWHVRYVGLEKAKRLTESGLTVEEYYGLTSAYS